MSTAPPEGSSPGFEEPPVTWARLAPWLEDRHSDPEFFWLDDDPADTDPEVRKANYDLIAVLIAETRDEVPLGDLLPLLPDGIDLIPDETLPSRAANWLLQSSTFTTGRIKDITTAHLLNQRGMGIGSVLPLLARLVELSTRRPGHGADAAPVRSGDALLADLSVIARWRTALGQSSTPLLAPLPDFAPAELHAARARLDALTARDPALGGPARASVAEQLSARLDDLGERDFEVFLARRLRDDRTRLEALGERFGVSRERVRQYEARALDELQLWLRDTADARLLVDALTRVIGTVRPLADVLEAVPAAGERVAAADLPLWRVLAGIGVPFEVSGDWAAAPSIDAARQSTEHLLTERADDHGVVDPADLAEAGARTPGGAQWQTRWARELGHVVFADRILLRTATVEDYAAAILSVRGEPMTADEIVDAFHVERSARSVINQMTGDDRFQRTTRTGWGLSAWGGPGYRSIRVAIGELLDARGGEVALTDLVAELTAAYDVKSSSVAAYAAAPPFVTHDGVVRRAEQAPQARKSPAQTRNLYRVGRAWKLRISVNREHLRGSGTPLPVALATALGLEPGETRGLVSPDGEQHLSWTALQPTLGSTRRFFAALGIADGDEAFFVFTDCGGFDVKAVSRAGSGAAGLLALIGAQKTDEPDTVLAALAAAVGLPADSTVTAIRAAYQARGEDDVVAGLGG